MPWRGIYSGLPIEFKIDDKDFLEQVYDQEIKFGNGTSITCNLQIETKTTIKDDIEEAKNADRVILLNKGEIVDCDKPQKILTNEKLLKELKYDRLYLNTPVRPPAEADVNVVSEERMRYAVETLGGISIEMMSSGAFFSEIEDDYEAVKSIIGRHPMNQFEVRGFLESRDVKDPEAMMEQMKKDEAIHVIDYKGILTFRLK